METLEQLIREECEQSPSRMIPFARFMEQALYHPRYGYYTANRPKVGKKGDFYTSASVHPVFAETIADAIVSMIEVLKPVQPTIVEIGGGTGYLMKHLLTRIRNIQPELFAKLGVIVIEASPYHRALQQEAFGHMTNQIEWYDSLAEAAKERTVEGVIFSNEWLDAFPVHIVEQGKDGLAEIGVRWDEQAAAFAECVLPALTPQISRFLAKEKLALATSMRAEICLGMHDAVRDVSSLLARGAVITIDYGDRQELLHHPARNRGTLMCYHQHHAHDDPFRAVGEQDMTAHVNFSLLEKWGEEAGLSAAWYGRQDDFLIKSGILQKLVEHQDRDPFTSVAMKVNRAIQQLILPGGMGGVFKVLVQTKDAPEELTAHLQRKDARF
ncbi:UNVERIFIED_CONTAM: SAM-dependent MidA family methyltransferase [Brevibacillus sp. OAP136]